MVELGEARVMNKKMLKKLKRHHGHRHGHGHDGEHHNGDAKLSGALGPAGSEIVVVLRGKHHYHHHHHHHHYHADPSAIAMFHDGEDQEGQCHSKHHHHRRGPHGHAGQCVMEGIRGLKHHIRRHHHLYQQYCRGLGLDFQHHQQQQDTEAGAAGPVTPTAPETELMMKNLSPAEDKEPNKPI